MKRNRLFFLLTALTLTMALAAMAQAPGRPVGQGPRPPAQGPAGPGPLGGPQLLVRYLDLTEEQILKWRSFQEQAHAEIAPLAELRRANAEKIREALESGTPNATAIGELVIKNHEIGAQVRGIHEAAQAKFAGILTPEQKPKYDNYLELLKSMRPGGGAGLGEGAGGTMGFGPGQGGGFGGGDGACGCCGD